MNSGGEGSSYEELEEAIKSHPDERKLPHLGPESTFRITVDSFGKVMSLQEHNERIRGLSCIPFKGRVSLKNPDINFWLMETDESATNNGLPPVAQRRIFFLVGKLVEEIGSLSPLHLSWKSYEQHLCSNLCDDKLFEFIQGADIDIRVVRDGRGPDCNVWSNFEQKLTMVKTSPYTEELASAAWIKHLEFKENHAKWLELRRGPIGFSAYSKSKSKSERQRKEMASHLMVTDFTLPLKSYKLSHLRQQRKGRSNGWQNVPTTVAYYGLKTPPYNLDGLEPYMSKRALEMHWGVHHRGFVDDLNKQLGKSDILYGYTMDELVKATYNNGNPLPEFNNCSRGIKNVWNHDFFWEPMQPGGGDMPKLGLLEQIEKDFGSFNFREKFVETALSLFGSGWPILNLDMWEHAYYLDYKNDKAKYVSTFVNHLVSWNAATVRMARAEAFVNLGEPKIPIA
ncbi:hypothetical protein V6N13_114799 [Hibiscus sabdariffa]